MADRPVPHTRATRSAVLAPHGMAATSQPLATAVALQVLQEGGHAVDAAVAAAATLCVVEPHNVGPGGDLFALVYDAARGQVRGLNASGGAPALATAAEFRRRGLDHVPVHSILSATVPGAVDGWGMLLAEYGRLPLERLLAPAIAYAERGFPVSEIIAHQWQRESGHLQGEARRIYLPGGRAPRFGEVHRQPELARTLRHLAEHGTRSFYEGDLAERIARGVAEAGGLIRASDLAAHHGEWVEPIHTTYRGVSLYEIPPNGQGLTALIMLNILENFDLAGLGHNSAEHIHLLVEAKKLAYADRDRYIADPRQADVPVAQLLSKEYAARRAAQIGAAAGEFGPGLEVPGDTVYLTMVDKDRNCVSLIQSLFYDFGCGVAAGDTGVLLHNRGHYFRVDEAHPNCIAPGKRPMHTIIPAMALREGRPFLSFGVMGGDMQPQGQVQVLSNMVDFGMNVQEAGEAPRVRHYLGQVCAESGVPHSTLQALWERGHQVGYYPDIYGGYQGILVDLETGMLHGGSDPRKDGCALGY